MGRNGCVHGQKPDVMNESAGRVDRKAWMKDRLWWTMSS